MNHYERALLLALAEDALRPASRTPERALAILALMERVLEGREAEIEREGANAPH